MGLSHLTQPLLFVSVRNSAEKSKKDDNLLTKRGGRSILNTFKKRISILKKRKKVFLLRKLISVALAVFMILAMMTGVFTTTVAAADADGSVPLGYTPEGAAINSAEDFAAMVADGKYYLAADITITASYATEFTGTFDGNGKTVTVSAPMFANLNGATVKNLKTVGQIDYATYAVENKLDTGAVAGVARLSSFENVYNEATIYGARTGYVLEITHPETFEVITEYYGLNTGGLVGLIEGTTTFKDCANGGMITGLTPGGLVGPTYRHTLKAKEDPFADAINSQMESLFEKVATKSATKK